MEKYTKLPFVYNCNVIFLLPYKKKKISMRLPIE